MSTPAQEICGWGLAENHEVGVYTSQVCIKHRGVIKKVTCKDVYALLLRVLIEEADKNRPGNTEPLLIR